MRFTNSKDGVKRTNLRVQVRLSVEDIAVLLVSNSSISSDDVDPEAWAEEMVQKSDYLLLCIVREEVERNGTEIPSYRVGDNGLDKHALALTKRLEQKWRLV